VLIILPVRDAVLFPGVVLPIAVGRQACAGGGPGGGAHAAARGLVLQKRPGDEDVGPESSIA
jgi:ATP-dependent Lon protease